MSRLVTTRRRLVTGLGAAAALAGCGPNLSGRLRVSFAPLTFRTLYETLAAQFEAANPGVRIELDGSRSYEDLAQKTLREAIVDDLPDLSHQGMSQVRMLADRGLARPLDPFMTADREWKDLGYLESFEDFGRFSGRTVGLPFAVSTPVVFFNTNLVRMAGGDPVRPPEDWSGILDLARRIRERAGAGTISLYLDYGASSAWMWESLVFSQGGRMTTPDERTPAFSGPMGLNALQVLADCRAAGQVDISREQAMQAFAAGALGIFISSSSNLTSLRQQAGKRFGVAMRSFPLMAVDGKLPAGGNTLTLLAKDPARQAVGWRYIRFLLSAPAQALMARQSGYVPVNGRAIIGPDYLKPLYARDAEAARAVAQIPVLTGWYAFPGDNTIRITDELRQQMQEVATGRASPATALAIMTDRTRVLLSRPR